MSLGEVLSRVAEGLDRPPVLPGKQSRPGRDQTDPVQGLGRQAVQEGF